MISAPQGIGRNPTRRREEDDMGTYDRRTQDLGNIVMLEHCNVRVPDQSLATLFYVLGLGGTRDPYLQVELRNMWVNLGQQQFHLPTGQPQVFPGHIGIVTQDYGALPTRLAALEPRLAGTAFTYTVEDKFVGATCPWGNRVRLHAPGPRFGDMTLGIPYVEFPVAPGTAAGIGRFYDEVMGAPATITADEDGLAARVRVGTAQELVFRETTGTVRPYDGHHVAVYVADFSGPHARLLERGLVSEESNQVQYRFKDIVDPDSGRHLFTIEHEVRCVTHPMFLRPLINRNPAQRQATYQRGRDAYVPGLV
jgi:hypothetical protein